MRKKRYYSSELVYEVLTGMWKNRISPGRLFSELNKGGDKMKSYIGTKVIKAEPIKTRVK